MAKGNHWKNAAFHNLPLHKKLAKQKGHGFRVFGRTYKERRELWVLAAGMLDTARYLNVTRMGLADLHDEDDGNMRERSIWQELNMFIESEHSDAFRQFQNMYSVSTDNFANTERIKSALHDIVFDRASFAATDNPVVLLAAAVVDSRYIKPTAA